MAIEYWSRPLPECTGCGAPMERRRWAVAGGRCSSCRTAPEAIAAAHRAARLASVQTDTPLTTEQRIERLAAKRAARISSS